MMHIENGQYPDPVFRMPERRSCCGRFCEITYTFLSDLCAAIVAIFLKIFGSESPAQPAVPLEFDQAVLQQQQQRAAFLAQIKSRQKAQKPADAEKDSPAKAPTIEESLNAAIATLSNPSASLDELNAADAMLGSALERHKDDKAWENQLHSQRTILLKKLYGLAKADSEISQIDASLASADSAIETSDLFHTKDEYLENACKLIQAPNASIDSLLLADKILTTAHKARKHEKPLIIKVQEARGNIFYRMCLLDPHKYLKNLDETIERFRVVIGSLSHLPSDLSPLWQLLGKFLFVRYQQTNQKDDLNECIAIYTDTISKLPPNMQPQAHCELGDAYTLRNKNSYDLDRALMEFKKAALVENQGLDFYVRAQAKINILALMKEGLDLAEARNQIANKLLESSKEILQNDSKTTKDIHLAIINLRVALEFEIPAELREQIEQTRREAENSSSSSSYDEDAFSLL